VITEITDEDLVIELNALGFMVGEEIIMTNKAPMGDPLIVRCSDSLVSLRKKDASCVHVQIKQEDD